MASQKTALVFAGSPSLGDMSPVESVKSLISLPPELVGETEVIEWSRQPSSHYTIRVTTDLLELFRSLIGDGYSGIAVASGTDVMEEMAYLVDLLWPYPNPIVFTGLGSPARHGSNEGAVNLRQAVVAASSEACWGMGVLIFSRGELFAASEACKFYSHRGHDFASPGAGPVGEVVQNRVYVARHPRRARVIDRPVVPAKDVEVLYASLGGGELTLSHLFRDESLKGLVLGCFGTGNVPPSWTPHIKNLIRRRVPVVLTSRCQLGRVLSLYDFEGSASRLLDMGAIDGGTLRPLQARLRLAVAVGAGMDEEEIREYMLS
ncbi:asparaginase [Thermanaerovibrio acidaminovorans]|uniref:asparaginase n=1 Tax=Thermanaerovibrio acidaminovorans TaxID=81462 RepID=UPI0024904A75|nr:asparaginase [Thermanaerovibrio acidaminovorans]